MVTRDVPRRRRDSWALLLAFALAAVFAADSVANSSGQVSISLNADHGGAMQIFFDRGDGFSEQNSGRFRFAAGSSTHTVHFPDGQPLKALRMDPEMVGSLRLEKILVQNSRSLPLFEISLKHLTALAEIASLEIIGNGSAIITIADARDAQLFLPVQDQFPAHSWKQTAGRICQALLLFGLGLAIIGRLATQQTGIPLPALLFGAWLLIAAMAFASTTSHSVHPDEFSHVSAATYYRDHWLPPPVDAPEIAGSYSVYGATYLNELDVVYLIAAKVSKLWSGLGLDEVTQLRLFNVLLFGALLIAAWVRPVGSPATSILLLTPQIWYVFSYFNADAFALFLSLFATLMFAGIDSPVSRFINGGRAARVSLGLFSLALGLLLVSKRNYLPFVLVTGLILAARHLELKASVCVVAAIGIGLLVCRSIAGRELAYMFPHTFQWFTPAGVALSISASAAALWTILRRPPLRLRLFRVALLFLLAAAVALPRVIADVAANGSPLEKSRQMSAAAELHAEDAFKPSTLATNLSASYPGLKLAAKGTSLWQILGPPHEWLTISWHSLLGVYGYMSIFAPQMIYALLSSAMLLLCISMVAWAFSHERARPELGIVVIGATLVGLASVMQSWANDFQAQGRYLFPALAMFAAYLQSQPDLSKTYATRIAIAGCYAGCVLSFVTVALPALAGR